MRQTIIVPRKSLKESILIIATKITIIKVFLVKRLLKVMHNLIKKLTAGAVGAGHQAIDSGLRAKGEDSAKICGICGKQICFRVPEFQKIRDLVS